MPPPVVLCVCATPTTLTLAVKLSPVWALPSRDASPSTMNWFPLESTATSAASATVANVLLLMLYSATVPVMV